MKIGVTKFPGTNNEQDVLRALSKLDVKGILVKPYENKSLEEFDALILTGGFSYGDYIRPGVLAAHSPLLEDLPNFVETERFVLGICNGFQILCETNILPGILTTNRSTKFISKWIYLKSNQNSSPLLKETDNKVLKLPIAHYDGRYYNKENEIEELDSKNQIAFQYCDKDGNVTHGSNPNGSIRNIAGIINSKGNVLGLMPHPERASFDYLGSEDGIQIFINLLEEIKC